MTGPDDRSRKILMWCELFWPHMGGIEHLALEILRSLNGRGFTFEVITALEDASLPAEDDLEGIPVHRLPFRTALREHDPERIIGCRRRIEEIRSSFEPDLIHLNGLYPGCFFHLMTRQTAPAPTLVTLHQEMPDGPSSGPDSLFHRVIDSADWITACSESILAQILALRPDLETRSSTIRNAVAEPAREPAPLPLAPPRLLCVGRLAPQKGFDVALRALAGLTGRLPGLELIVAGEGSERTALEEQAGELGIIDRVEFTGRVESDRIPDLMNRATLVVMPSRWEGLPLVAIQAAWMGRPVVATDVGGMPEIVIPGRTGCFVPVEDSVSLAGAIAELLGDPDRVRRYGRAAREHAADEFSLEHHLEQYRELYRRLTAGRSETGPGPA